MSANDSLSAWHLDHAWMQDTDTRPIADDLAIGDAQPDDAPPPADPEDA